ncbi:chemotaxis protein CheD [Bacterioplanes sanyensis]|uniref:Probable chemoreceptor glutamine deamidase CheD n=1 Tax=Bacterioplanes sanyensis TaxID=1249553 RepID=A0A222FM79_9GAMM|nr:chemotaxis protein CheD [Bacterioplanes sanyensis]ASP39333.1 chemotaxis protein CheD [Bacterioplanes sanyensis]
MTTYTVAPGEYRVSDQSSVILKTLLGSCVAVCLYDERVHVFGMNHFLLALDKYHQQSSVSGRYGIHAMELLINAMLKRGAEKKRMKAKVFGGANVLNQIGQQHFNIGQANVEFAFDFLQQEAIPVSSHDVGGENGRTILFDGSDLGVYVRLIDGRQQAQLLVEDESQWLSRQQQQQQRQPAGTVVFWDD